ncbi:alpha/beta-hydrolase [Massarina eburnea CBS 473.64]|uniref:Alpha/beta-hydrolase n=1 Tax=Massarina eburnea CBS 473.64 TaxID=1395130 RepID=A0A6A6RKD8_9PLEO|nr:alpha/beta-hydrolase [Massarina eburnea CBS 473.64]
MNTDTIKHPTLNCGLRGRSSTSTTQFRNLKYAVVPGRWEDSVLNNTLSMGSEEVFDATNFGPSCPQHRGAQVWDLSLVGNVNMPLGEGHHGIEEEMDEFNCLTVNVTVPKVAVEGNIKKLPVFVWVHGGGLSMGSNSWPQYDLTKFVELSVEIGKPVIGVSINYRVGILGFLACQELGIEGNFGFKDQVLAFRWIKKHIEGFGGDPNNVTAAGESAGGISLSVLLCADVGKEGLFERVVVMSGEATLRKPRNILWHEELYRDQLKFLKLDSLSVEERSKRLRNSDADKLIHELPLAQHFCACIDGRFIKEDITPGTMSDGRNKQHKPDWCTEFVIGDAAYDGTVLKGRILDNPNTFASLKTRCAEYLTSSDTATLFTAYNLPAVTPEQQQRNLLKLVSELRFYLPTLTIHLGWKKRLPSTYCRRYHFHVPNSIQGAFVGIASHEFDVACLLRNFEEYMDEGVKEVARQMANKWVMFANGKGWCQEGKVIVIGGKGVIEVDEIDYDAKHRNGRGKVLEKIGAGRLWDIVEEWQGVRSEEKLGKAKI